MTPRDESHSPNWGGARPGGGRPKTGRKVKTYALVLPPEVIEAVDAAAAERGVSRSRVVADALRARFNLTPGLAEEAQEAE